ncbi:MAG: PVC-type heme-binding CxxCH protein [Planctomycetota bacterium]|nr:PVC-type heme-binding CxxCH protein [Planctomycetota bacterium]
MIFDTHRRNATNHFAALFAFAVATLLASPAFAQRDLTDIPAPDPEEERRSFEVADGFEVNLFAADPLLAKPIQMNWDAQGRLWVASSETYPQIFPGKKANDKILILEDSNEDGVADKTTVFADGLLIPTGVEPGDGGAYVANSTELLHMADTDGDGKADRTRVMLSGFGTEDTHHILHTFRHGPDGLLYFTQSIYIHSNIETPYGVKRLARGGTWQFRPKTMELDVFCYGLVNQWGTAWDRWGATFLTDGAGGDGINYAFPGAVFATAADTTRVLKGLNPGSPKDCGVEVLSGRHLPEDWRGNLITNDFRAHRVVRYVPSEDGSGYSTKEMPELLKTKHVAFRPIDVKMGPDGAIYVADWYNPIIQHGEVDFRDERRDKTHGRIWRISAKGRPLVKRPKLVGAPTAELLEQLKSPEDWTRHFAKRVLTERANESEARRAEVLSALGQWVEQLTAITNYKPAPFDVEQARLEALWLYQSINQPNQNRLQQTLQSPNPQARAAATRVLAAWQSQLNNPTVLLQAMATDSHPRVRLEAVRAASAIGTVEAARIALGALDLPQDRFLDFALWKTARDLKSTWLPAAQQGKNPFAKVDHLLFALKSVNSPEIVQPLMKLVEHATDEQIGSILALVAETGGAAELRTVFDSVIAGKSLSTKRRAEILELLVETGRRRQIVPKGDLSSLASLLSIDDPRLQKAVLVAIGQWKVRSLLDQLTRVAADAKSPADIRLAAIEGLSQFGKSATEALTKLAAAPQPFEIRLAASNGLSQLDSTLAATAAVALLKDWPAANDPSALLSPLLQRKENAPALTAALANQKLSVDTAKLAVRAVRSSSAKDEKLLSALATAGGLSSEPRVYSPTELKQILADVRTSGDAKRGEAIYRRAELSCLKCHAIGGSGGLVGPDLLSIGASAQPDYLLESLLEPSKKIKENYNSYTILGNDGRTHSGIRIRKDDREVVLRDAEGKEMVIPVSQIDEEEDSTTSLMPAGLVDSLTHAELVDLVKFLTELGKVGSPYTISRTPTARRWLTPLGTEEGVTKLRRIGMHQALGDGADLVWNSVYTEVSGDLPLDSLMNAKYGANNEPVALARTQIEVTTPGKVLLHFNSNKGLRFWVDKKQIDLTKDVLLDLPAGVHNLIVAVNLNDRKEPLRLEIPDNAQTTAKVQFVGGK